jgi:hypothetical protein
VPSGDPVFVGTISGVAVGDLPSFGNDMRFGVESQPEAVVIPLKNDTLLVPLGEYLDAVISANLVLSRLANSFKLKRDSSDMSIKRE